MEQRGAGGGQVGVVVPGMTDYLPCSLRQVGERLAQQGTVSGTVVRTIGQAGLDHSHRAVGRKQSSALRPLEELSGEGGQHAHLAITLPEIWLIPKLPRGHRCARNERVADRSTAANARSPQQRRENLGKDMGVFVRVEVSNLEAGGLNFPYLCGDFRDQWIGIEASQHGASVQGTKPVI